MEFRSRIPSIIDELAAKLDASTAEGADIVAEHARGRVPVATGTLRDAIHTERLGLGVHAVVAGNTEAFYGHIIEHGGVRVPAHPFLVPAMEESRDEVIKLTAVALRTL